MTTFAGAYFTVVSKTKLPYNSVDIPLENLNKIDTQECYIDAELSKVLVNTSLTLTLLAVQIFL